MIFTPSMLPTMSFPTKFVKHTGNGLSSTIIVQFGTPPTVGGQQRTFPSDIYCIQATINDSTRCKSDDDSSSEGEISSSDLCQNNDQIAAGAVVKEICAKAQNQLKDLHVPLRTLCQFVDQNQKQKTLASSSLPSTQTIPISSASRNDMIGLNFNGGELWIWYPSDCTLSTAQYIIVICEKKKNLLHVRASSDSRACTDGSPNYELSSRPRGFTDPPISRTVPPGTMEKLMGSSKTFEPQA